jgi:hypothetical protein
MDSIAGFILVGGESRRMGTDKAGLMLNGQSFVDRIADKVSSVTTSVSIVGSNSSALQLIDSSKLPFVPDVSESGRTRWRVCGAGHLFDRICRERLKGAIHNVRKKLARPAESLGPELRPQ